MSSGTKKATDVAEMALAIAVLSLFANCTDCFGVARRRAEQVVRERVKYEARW